MKRNYKNKNKILWAVMAAAMVVITGFTLLIYTNKDVEHVRETRKNLLLLSEAISGNSGSYWRQSESKCYSTHPTQVGGRDHYFCKTSYTANFVNLSFHDSAQKSEDIISSLGKEQLVKEINKGDRYVDSTNYHNLNRLTLSNGTTCSLNFSNDAASKTLIGEMSCDMEVNHASFLNLTKETN